VIELNIETARVFTPFGQPSRYKGAWGGRGSGKSHDFAQRLVKRAVKQQGLRWLCGRQVQKSLKESAKFLIEAKIKALNAPGFRIRDNDIVTPGGGVIAFTGMQDHTSESIKSYEGFDGFWGEEAHKFTDKALSLLRPTIRGPGSELWFSWNPQRKTDPVDKLLRGPHALELGAIVVEANWRDNPWFPEELDREREYDFKHSPETYEHVWEGGYATVVKGAYYAMALAAAQREGRITRLAVDPLCQVRACWDLGVSDATAIWIVQFVGREIRVLDYIEGEGQALAYYVTELRERGWDRALCVLPHDGARRDSVTAIKYEDHLRDAGFKTQTLANQGAGAAQLRIEAVRRAFPRIWFNDTEAVEAGREWLGSYHEKRDEERQIGLGPLHDAASNAADAFGLMIVAYEPPKPQVATPARRVITTSGEQSTAWMGR